MFPQSAGELELEAATRTSAVTEVVGAESRIAFALGGLDTEADQSSEFLFEAIQSLLVCTSRDEPGSVSVFCKHSMDAEQSRV